MKPFRFHRKALAEANAAAEHYATIGPQIGQRFYDTVDLLVREVCAQPTLFRVFDPPARRHFRAPFPFALNYLDLPERNVAVAPIRMQLGYWRNRLG